MVKICGHCQQTRDKTEFYRHARGLSSWCKSCCREHSRKQAKSGYFKSRRKKMGLHPRLLLTPVERCAYALWDNAKKRSIRMGKEFSLDRQWVLTKVAQFCQGNPHNFTTGSPFKPSLDRIDNSLGYTQTNIKVTWVIDNLAKQRFTEEQVLTYCKMKLGLGTHRV